LLGLLARADEIEIADACSGGILAERLGTLLRNRAYLTQADGTILSTEWHTPSAPEDWITEALNSSDPTTLSLAIAGFNDAGQWAFGLREGAHTRVEAGPTPYRRVEVPELLDRAKRYAVEFALKRWCEWLESTVQ